jgi:hypothetical protein
MPITINGTGTITGISAGGLPDAIITQPEIATGVAGTGPAFSAYASSGTSVANNTLTKITLDTEEFDTNNNFASSRFTPTVAGYYQINGCIGGAYATLVCTIFKNGTEYKRGVTASGATLNQANVSSIVYLNGSTDYVELYTYQGSGSTQTMSSGISGAYFNGAMVRGA